MKNTILIIAIVFNGMLVQSQDTVTMKNGTIYTGKVQVISGDYIQIIDGGTMNQIPERKVKHIKYDNSLHKNFKWEYIVELPGTKEELYNKANLVIADMYNSANNVVQLSDINNGILVKAKADIYLKVNMGMHVVHYYFPYTLKVVFKDNKYRVTIDKVGNGEPTDYRYSNIPATDMFDGDVWKYNVTKKQHATAMRALKTELTLTISAFKIEMNQALSVNNDW